MLFRSSAPPGEKSAAYSEQESGGNLSQPLAVRGEPIGQLTVNAPQELPDEAAEIVAEVAERLSTHLESLRLTRQTEAALARIEDQAQRLAHLSALGAELNAATRLVEVFDLLATRARDIIAHDQMSLALLNPQRTALDLYDGLELQTSQPPSQIIPLVGTLLGAVVSSGRMKHIFDLPEIGRAHV